MKKRDYSLSLLTSYKLLYTQTDKLCFIREGDKLCESFQPQVWACPLFRALSLCRSAKCGCSPLTMGKIPTKRLHIPRMISDCCLLITTVWFHHRNFSKLAESINNYFSDACLIIFCPESNHKRPENDKYICVKYMVHRPETFCLCFDLWRQGYSYAGYP